MKHAMKIGVMLAVLAMPGMARADMVDLTAGNGWFDVIFWYYMEYGPGAFGSGSVDSVVDLWLDGAAMPATLNTYYAAFTGDNGALEGNGLMSYDVGGFLVQATTEATGSVGFQPGEGVGSWMITLDTDDDGIGQFDTDNRQRDAKNRRKLRKLGWDILVVWECQVGDPDQLAERIRRFLDS